MALLDKLTKTTQDMVKGTKDITEVARLNSLIAEEKKQRVGFYQQIGKLYFDMQVEAADPETPIGKFCLNVNAANERIAKYNAAIRQIKGLNKCPSCGAEVPVNIAFCGVCGTKVEVETLTETKPEAVKKFCENCGAELAEGVAFCTSCGQKQENTEIEA